jgi:hypothetical protein
MHPVVDAAVGERLVERLVSVLQARVLPTTAIVTSPPGAQVRAISALEVGAALVRNPKCRATPCPALLWYRIGTS